MTFYPRMSFYPRISVYRKSGSFDSFFSNLKVDKEFGFPGCPQGGVGLFIRFMNGEERVGDLVITIELLEDALAQAKALLGVNA